VSGPDPRRFSEKSGNQGAHHSAPGNGVHFPGKFPSKFECLRRRHLTAATLEFSKIFTNHYIFGTSMT
jgi:hypothetical protein